MLLSRESPMIDSSPAAGMKVALIAGRMRWSSDSRPTKRIAARRRRDGRL
jgi:hypothetical protein